MRDLLPLTPLVVLALCVPARAARVLVVATDPMSASTREAYDALVAEVGEPVELADAASPLPPGPHGVVVALGGRAAARVRDAKAPVVVALAPKFRGEARGGLPLIRVAMTPSPERFASLLAASGARRLLALRAATGDRDYLRRAAACAKAAGVAVDDAALVSVDDLPSVLRAASSSVDAVWLAPDPDAVTPESFGVVREFARARGVPFFAPTSGLVIDGARGELAMTFRDCGRAAGAAARSLLDGRAVAKVVFPADAPAGDPVLLSTRTLAPSSAKIAR